MFNIFENKIHLTFIPSKRLLSFTLNKTKNIRKNSNIDGISVGYLLLTFALKTATLIKSKKNISFNICSLLVGFDS